MAARRAVSPLVVLLLVVALGPTGRGEDEAGLQSALASYLEAEDVTSRIARAKAIRAMGADARRVAELAPRAWRWTDDVPTGRPVSWRRETRNGAEHTVYAYAPEAYAAERSWPVLVWLHGTAMRDEDGGGNEGLDVLVAAAEAHGFLVLCPSTRKEAPWWTDAGLDLVRGALLDLKRAYRVDADRVALAGWSDGGTACYHVLTHDPEPYCCFLAFLGHPRVAQEMGGPCWVGNLDARPLYAVNGGRDPLYPARAVRPYVEALEAAGCDLTWEVEPDAEHDLAAVGARLEEALAFWRSHARDPLPRQLGWTTSRPRERGRRGWVEIQRLDSAEVCPANGTEPGTLYAEVVPGNRIEVAADGVGAARLHLSPSLVDFDRELAVILNGAEVFRGLPPRDLQYALDEATTGGPGAPVFLGFLDLLVTPCPPAARGDPPLAR